MKELNIMMSILVIETDAQRFVFVYLLLFVPSIINIQVIFEMNEWVNTILPIISYCDFIPVIRKKGLPIWDDKTTYELIPWNDLHFLKRRRGAFSF